MQNLFLGSELEKTARRGVSLNDNPDEWPADILKEAFHQAPYLADYEVSVVLDRQDDKQGYAFGHLAVQNKAGSPIAAPMDAPLEDSLAKIARIPLVVREGELRPFKVFVKEGSFHPLTETRLGSSLFRADLMELEKSRPGDQSLVDQLYPPYKNRQGFGPGESKYACVLQKIGAALSPERRDAVLGQIKSDPALLYAVEHNEAFSDAVSRISSTEPLTAEQAATAVRGSLRPDVIQIEKGAGFYKVKTANAAVFEPQETRISRAELLEHFGQETADRLDTKGILTAGRSFSVDESEAPAQPITSFGRYRVKEASGSWREGWVFPFLVDLDMSVRNTALFTDGHHGAVQEKVAGVEVEGAVFPSGGRLKGTGCFMAASGNEAIATIPMTIKNAVRTVDQNYHLAETMDGRQVKLSRVHGLRKIASLGPDHYAIPAEMDFVPVRGGLKLISSPDEVPVQGFAQKVASTVTVRSDGSCYALEGEPLDKLASEQRNFVPRQDAEFLLVAAGAHPTRAHAVLADADAHGISKLSGLRPLTSYEDALAQGIEERVLPMLKSCPSLRMDLLKEAAAIEDANTVDAVLALNFISPDNMVVFRDNIEEFEKAASHLAELYVATQLGLHNMDEDAICRAMSGLDNVITGLNSLEGGI